MADALTEFAKSVSATPQSKPDPRHPEQERNSAGGHGWRVDDWTRLHRFLVIGTEGGTYYTRQPELTRDNAAVVLRLLAEDGPRVVEHVARVSETGVAPKNDQALFALALAAAHTDAATRSAAFQALPRVARTGTHWFQFVRYAKLVGRGWGRAYARAVAELYTGQPVDRVALQAIKYRQREGWTHRDLLRKAHPVGATPEQRALLAWIAQGTVSPDLPRTVKGHLLLNQPGVTAELAATTIREYRLPWESVPDRLVNEWEVLDALLDSMPPGALLRQLPRLTRSGFVPPIGAFDPRLSRLVDPEFLRRGRVHPVSVLNALLIYQRGEGRGGRDWTPNPRISVLLDEAFHVAFGHVEPAGKVTLVGLDVSASMDWPQNSCAGMPSVRAREAAAAMCMTLVRTEPSCGVLAFATQPTPLPVTPNQRLDDVIRLSNSVSFGGTDCSLPMLWALEAKARVDTFVIYTDSETWAGAMHPHQALDRYRQWSGIPARLVVQAMTAAPFSIADPSDPGMLDLVGFDSSSPRLTTEFSAGRL